MTTIPTGPIAGNPILMALLKRALRRALKPHNYSPERERLIVAESARQLCAAGLYVTESGNVWMPEWTVH